MSKTFVTSDLHFGHSNVIKYCPESRGSFTHVDDMDAKIVENINSVVTDDDILFILGDIAFAKPAKAVDYLKQLNGQKVFVWGNHDKKLRESSEFQMSKNLIGCISTADYLCETFVADEARYKVAMMHFPLLTWDGAHHGTIMLHGHSHSPKSHRDTMPGKRIRDIGIDGNDLMPYNMTDLVRELATRAVSYHGHHDGSRN